jgi:hypothetical protein
LQQGDIGPIWIVRCGQLGVFSFTGDPRWTYTLPGRPLFDGVTAVLFYAGLVIALWRIRQPAYAFALIWLAVGLIPSAITPQAPSTVRLVGAMPVVYVLVGLAVNMGWRVASGEWRVTRHPLPATRHPLPATRYLFLPLLALLLAGNIVRTVRDGFVRWPQAEATRLNHYQSVWLDVARYLQAEPGGFLVVADAFYEPIDGETLRYNLGFDPAARWVQSGASVAGALVLPPEGGGRLIVPEFAPMPPELLALAGIAPEPVYRSTGWPSFAVYELPAAPLLTDVPLADFEQVLSLLAHVNSASELEDELLLYTWWQVRGRLPADLTAFVHVVDADGTIVAQADGLDSATATVQVGDVIVQRHRIALPEGLSPGIYEWYVGVYEAGNGRRWQHAGDPNDRWLLPGVTIDEK